MAYIENYRQIRDEIRKTALSHGCNPDDITIIAVSKTFSPETIQAAIDEGIYIFGENKVQEAKKKIPMLAGKFDFHLVGHLQSNKAKDAVQLFSMIHSIDKLSTAEKVNDEAKKIGKVQKILVQVNTSHEDTKSGIEPENTVELCGEILKLENCSLRGLMTIGPFTDDKARVRSSFTLLRKTLEKTNSSLGTDLKELSMGMSSDYLIAVEEGATLVRIGTSIFGNRDYANGTS